MSWLVLLLLFVIFFIKFLKKRLNYFKDQNIPYLKSTPLFGILDNFIAGRKNLFECHLDAYNNPDFKNVPFFGIFNFHTPAIVFKDPDLINRIFIKDSKYFINRSMSTDERDPMHSNIGEFLNNLKIILTANFLHTIKALQKIQHGNAYDLN